MDKVKIGGQEVDLGPLVAKLLAGDGVKIEDLLPFGLNLIVGLINKPHVVPVPAPVQPAPAVIVENAPPESSDATFHAPSVAKAASLKLQPQWLFHEWTDTEGNRHSENQKAKFVNGRLSWGDFFRFDSSPVDSSGANLPSAPIDPPPIWHVEADGKKATFRIVDGRAQAVGFDQIPWLGTTERAYRNSNGACMAFKIIEGS